MGVMISASHNPYQDNGIKLFGPDGGKLSDISKCRSSNAWMAALPMILWRRNFSVAPRALMMRLAAMSNTPKAHLAAARSLASKSSSIARMAPLTKLRHGVVELGAEVIAIADKPDGRNINDRCGATHPHLMQEAVRCISGCASRLMVTPTVDYVDEKGRKIDGDS